MEGDVDAFEHGVSRLRDFAPRIAEQVLDEAVRGQVVPFDSLEPSLQAERASLLRDQRLGSAGKKDIATVPYGDEERLALLLRALEIAAQVAAGTRQRLLALAAEHHIHPQVEFTDADASAAREELADAERVLVPEPASEIALRREIEPSRQTAETVAELVDPILREL